MERVYKPNKNKKLQNLFLCQKQIHKLKQKVLNLIQQPCDTNYPYQKFSIIIPNKVYKKVNSKIKYHLSKQKGNQNINSNLINQRSNSKNRKKQCDCSKFNISSSYERQKNYRLLSRSPLKRKLNKSKVQNIEDQTFRKRKRQKSIKTQSTTEHYSERTLKSPKSFICTPRTFAIKSNSCQLRNKGIKYNSQVINQVTSLEKKDKYNASHIKIRGQQCSIMSQSQIRYDKYEDNEISPLNSRYLKTQQTIDSTGSKHSPKVSEFKCLYPLDQIEQPLRLSNLNISQNAYNNDKLNTIVEEKNLSLQLMKRICFKTQNFIKKQIDPYIQFLTKQQTLYAYAKGQDNNTTGYIKSSSQKGKTRQFKLWMNQQNQQENIK